MVELKRIQSKSSRRKHTSRFDDRGDTLVEVLVTVVIVGLAAAAILGTLLISISSSTQHRYLANDDTLARSAIESIKQQVELQQSSNSAFVDCSAATSTTPAPHPTGNPQVILSDWTGSGTYHIALPAVPPGYSGFSSNSVQISKVQCFNASSGALDSTCYATAAAGPPPGNTCSSDTSGILAVTVTVTDPSGYALNLSTLVRNPSFQAAYNGAF